MAKHGCHIGREANGGKVTSYDPGCKRYAGVCACGNALTLTAHQARNGGLRCAKCFVEAQRLNGAMAFSTWSKPKS